MIGIRKKIVASFIIAMVSLTTVSAFAAQVVDKKVATVTAKSGLNVRKNPKVESGNKIGVVLNGQKYNVLEEKNGWCKISVKGLEGWVSKDYLSITTEKVEKPEKPQKPEKETKYLYVNVDGLNFRESPTTKSKILSVLDKGEKIEFLEDCKGWTKVSYKGQIGYLGSSYLTDKPIENDKVENPTIDKPSSEKPDSDNINENVDVIEVANEQIGKPYKYAAVGPESFDCSGLIQYIFKEKGIKLPRTSKQQSTYGETVCYTDLEPGDLVFSSTDGSGKVSHVGIYIGNDEMIHAPKPGDVVKKEKINSRYWNKAYLWSKRVM